MHARVPFDFYAHTQRNTHATSTSLLHTTTPLQTAEMIEFPNAGAPERSHPRAHKRNAALPHTRRRAAMAINSNLFPFPSERAFCAWARAQCELFAQQICCLLVIYFTGTTTMALAATAPAPAHFLARIMYII